MADVRALNAKGITPELVLHSVGEDITQYRSLFVIGITKDEGRAVAYASGDVRDMSFAILSLQDLALDYLNGRVVEPGGG